MQDQEFKFKPSTFYLVIISLILLMSGAILCFLSMELSFKFLGLIVLSIYGGCLVYRYGLLRSQRSILSLRYLSDGRWYLDTRQGAYIAQLGGESSVTRFILVLRFKTEKWFNKQSCIVLWDSLSTEQYRRLSVLLRTQVADNKNN